MTDPTHAPADMPDALLPCPFCGGPAEIIGGKFPPLGTLYGVTCRGDCGTMFDCRQTHQSDAARQWNYRHPITSPECASLPAGKAKQAMHALRDAASRPTPSGEKGE